MSKEFVFLACGWGLWCVLHSLLIAPRMSTLLVSLLGRYRYYFRLLYNLFAGVTLAPLMVVTAMMDGGRVFSWQGAWHILRFAMLTVALLLFSSGARYYDFGFFLGIRQIRERRQPKLLADSQQFSRNGALGIVRHPWYLGSLLVLWSILPAYHLASVVGAVVLSLYLVVGTFLEEKKLVADFGEAYRSYRHEVSMLIPVKWIRTLFQRKN